MGEDEFFIPSLHSVGMPLYFGQRDTAWPCSPDNVWLAHFPDDPIPQMMGFGTAFGFLIRRSYNLRMGSALTKSNPKFLASHSSIIALKSPEGQKKYVCACMPAGTGQTSVSFLVPTLPGWTQRCVSTEIAWLNVGEDGRLYGINPQTGFFGLATGMSMLCKNSIPREY